MLNHITIMGRLTRDPELRRTGSGVAVANFTIANDPDYAPKDGNEKKPAFINCVAWRQTGEYISKYFTKGRMIVLAGRLEMRDWTDKEGNKHTSAEVVVENAYFGDSKREDGNPGGYGNAPQGGGYNAPANNQGYGAPQGGYQGGYNAPPMPASDYAMLDDDVARLPF